VIPADVLLAEADDVLCILGQVVWREDAMDMQTGNTAGKDAGRDKQAGGAETDERVRSKRAGILRHTQYGWRLSQVISSLLDRSACTLVRIGSTMSCRSTMPCISLVISPIILGDRGGCVGYTSYPSSGCGYSYSASYSNGYCDLCPSTYGYNYPNPYHAGTAPEWRVRVPTGMRETRMCGALPYVRVVDGSGLHHVPDFITERIVRCRSV
jgi:hypothetical protein